MLMYVVGSIENLAIHTFCIIPKPSTVWSIQLRAKPLALLDRLNPSYFLIYLENRKNHVITTEVNSLNPEFKNDFKKN